MAPVSHLKALQALDMALRTGSLRAAAAALGITSAAIGQRIRALEDSLGTPLLRRGPGGLGPSPELAAALPDLHAAFSALERVSDELDFRRASEIHIVADPDWSELWLLPRLAAFRAEHPNILFCINGVGDVPMRIGAPDLRVVCADGADEVLYHDILVPVTGPDNTRRITPLRPDQRLEGMPLLHIRAQRDSLSPGWVEWSRTHGHRDHGPERGVVYPNARLAIPAVRQNVGFLLCNLSFVTGDLVSGGIVLPFAPALHLRASHPYRLILRQTPVRRPQTERFLAWLRAAAAETARTIRTFADGPFRHGAAADRPAG